MQLTPIILRKTTGIHMPKHKVRNTIMAMTENAVASANIRMQTNYAGHTVKTYANPIRFLAPKGMESELGLDANTQYAVQAVPVPDGYRMVTQEEMETCKKPGDVVKFFSTKSVRGGAFKGVKDKASETWDNNIYVVPIGTVLKKDLSGTLTINGEEIELTDEQLEKLSGIFQG